MSSLSFLLFYSLLCYYLAIIVVIIVVVIVLYLVIIVVLYLVIIVVVIVLYLVIIVVSLCCIWLLLLWRDKSISHGKPYKTHIMFYHKQATVEFSPSSTPYAGISVTARELKWYATTQSEHQGSIFVRHSTSCDDLNTTDAILCGPYDGVLVVTYICMGESPVVSIC